MALTSTERSQRLRSDPAKKAAENERHNLARREQRAVAAEERREERRVVAEQAREAAIIDADKWRERHDDARGVALLAWMLDHAVMLHDEHGITLDIELLCGLLFLASDALSFCVDRDYRGRRGSTRVGVIGLDAMREDFAALFVNGAGEELNIRVTGRPG